MTKGAPSLSMASDILQDAMLEGHPIFPGLGALDSAESACVWPDEWADDFDVSVEAALSRDALNRIVQSVSSRPATHQPGAVRCRDVVPSGLQPTPDCTHCAEDPSYDRVDGRCGDGLVTDIVNLFDPQDCMVAAAAIMQRGGPGVEPFAAFWSEGARGLHHGNKCRLCACRRRGSQQPGERVDATCCVRLRFRINVEKLMGTSPATVLEAFSAVAEGNPRVRAMLACSPEAPFARLNAMPKV